MHQCVHVIRNATVDYRVYLYFQMMDNPQEVAEREPSRVAPHFSSFKGQNTSQFFVFVDNLVLTQCTTFAKALLACFFSHYVLNLEYAKQVKEVALFFQEFVCKLPAVAADKRQKNATYLSVTTDIQKYTM